MNKLSAKRKKAVTEGGEKLAYNSTFKRSTMKPKRELMSVEKLKASGLLQRASELSRTGKSERAKAKVKAWKYFSMFIRMRDAGSDGHGKCVTCNRRAHWRTMDAGHYITRAKESTLFSERNVHLQCKGCNRFQGGKFFEHEQAIERIHGSGTVEQLKRSAGMECKRTLNDYLFLAKTYKDRVEWIKKHEPGKWRKG